MAGSTTDWQNLINMGLEALFIIGLISVGIYAFLRAPKGD
jgi:hypothetical protein